MTSQPIDPQESQRIASAINDLLVDHGYPAERIHEWWNEYAYPQLDGRTPTRAWNDGAYDDVLSLIEQSYAASERAAKQLVDDGERFSRLRQRIAQLTDTYAQRRATAGHPRSSRLGRRFPAVRRRLERRASLDRQSR